jgi:hypothetical protein
MDSGGICAIRRRFQRLDRLILPQELWRRGTLVGKVIPSRCERGSEVEDKWQMRFACCYEHEIRQVTICPKISGSNPKSRCSKLVSQISPRRSLEIHYHRICLIFRRRSFLAVMHQSLFHPRSQPCRASLTARATTQGNLVVQKLQFEMLKRRNVWEEINLGRRWVGRSRGRRGKRFALLGHSFPPLAQSPTQHFAKIAEEHGKDQNRCLTRIGIIYTAQEERFLRYFSR